MAQILIYDINNNKFIRSIDSAKINESDLFMRKVRGGDACKDLKIGTFNTGLYADQDRMTELAFGVFSADKGSLNTIGKGHDWVSKIEDATFLAMGLLKTDTDVQIFEGISSQPSNPYPYVWDCGSKPKNATEIIILPSVLDPHSQTTTPAPGIQYIPHAINIRDNQLVRLGLSTGVPANRNSITVLTRPTVPTHGNFHEDVTSYNVCGLDFLQGSSTRFRSIFDYSDNNTKNRFFSTGVSPYTHVPDINPPNPMNYKIDNEDIKKMIVAKSMGDTFQAIGMHQGFANAAYPANIYLKTCDKGTLFSSLQLGVPSLLKSDNDSGYIYDGGNIDYTSDELKTMINVRYITAMTNIDDRITFFVGEMVKCQIRGVIKINNVDTDINTYIDVDFYRIAFFKVLSYLKSLKVSLEAIKLQMDEIADMITTIKGLVPVPVIPDFDTHIEDACYAISNFIIQQCCRGILDHCFAVNTKIGVGTFSSTSKFMINKKNDCESYFSIHPSTITLFTPGIIPIGTPIEATVQGLIASLSANFIPPVFYDKMFKANFIGSTKHLNKDMVFMHTTPNAGGTRTNPERTNLYCLMLDISNPMVLTSTPYYDQYEYLKGYLETAPHEISGVDGTGTKVLLPNRGTAYGAGIRYGMYGGALGMPTPIIFTPMNYPLKPTKMGNKLGMSTKKKFKGPPRTKTSKNKLGFSKPLLERRSTLERFENSLGRLSEKRLVEQKQAKSLKTKIARQKGPTEPIEYYKMQLLERCKGYTGIELTDAKKKLFMDGIVRLNTMCAYKTQNPIFRDSILDFLDYIQFYCALVDRPTIAGNIVVVEDSIKQGLYPQIKTFMPRNSNYPGIPPTYNYGKSIILPAINDRVEPMTDQEFLKLYSFVEYYLYTDIYFNTILIQHICSLFLCSLFGIRDGFPIENLIETIKVFLLDPEPDYGYFKTSHLFAYYFCLTQRRIPIQRDATGNYMVEPFFMYLIKTYIDYGFDIPLVFYSNPGVLTYSEEIDGVQTYMLDSLCDMINSLKVDNSIRRHLLQYALAGNPAVVYNDSIEVLITRLSAIAVPTIEIRMALIQYALAGNPAVVYNDSIEVLIARLGAIAVPTIEIRMALIQYALAGNPAVVYNERIEELINYLGSIAVPTIEIRMALIRYALAERPDIYDNMEGFLHDYLEPLRGGKNKSNRYRKNKRLKRLKLKTFKKKKIKRH